MIPKDRIHKTMKKAGIVLLIVVFLYAVLSVCATAVVYTALFRNLSPEVSFAYPYDSLAEGYPRTPSEFCSGDNTLRGYFYSVKGEPLGTVLVVNGIKSGADSHLAEICCFVDNGWQVFAYDATGVGASGGDSLVGLSQARLDLQAAVAHVKGLSDAPIVLYGHSVGGYASASVMEDTTLAAAVCLSPFNSPTDIMYYTAKERVGILADMERPFLMLQHWFVFGKEGYVTAVSGINATEAPVLICSGSHDEVIPRAASLSAGREPVTNKNAVLWEVPAGHADAWLSASAEQYTAALREEYAALSEKWGGAIPPAEQAAFEQSVDYALANELDGAFMDEVLTFFREAVE